MGNRPARASWSFSRELLGNRARVNIEVGFAKAVAQLDAEMLFVGFIDVDIVAVLILHPGDCRAVVHEQTETFFAIA